MRAPDVPYFHLSIKAKSGKAQAAAALIVIGLGMILKQGSA